MNNEALDEIRISSVKKWREPIYKYIYKWHIYKLDTKKYFPNIPAI